MSASETDRGVTSDWRHRPDAIARHRRTSRCSAACRGRFRSASFETKSLGRDRQSCFRREVVETMTGGRNDPRPARSRARLLDAATALLRSGGPSAVTVDAVTRAANVARATLYRHFPSGNDLLAAAFHALIPPAPTPPAEGSLRDRLIALVQAQAESDRRGSGHPDRHVMADAGRRPGKVAGRASSRLAGQPRGAHTAGAGRRTVRGPVRGDSQQPAGGGRTRRRRPHQGGGVTARPDRVGKAVHVAGLRLSRDRGRRSRRLSGDPPQEGQRVSAASNESAGA